MATKKNTETPAPTIDPTSMNVWERLLNLRTEFYNEGAKKSGINDHADFLYFELSDIVPIARPLFEKYRLFMQPTFENGNAIARVINIDKPEEMAVFTIPLVFIEQPGKYRMNEIQGVGSAVTYYRRYLYMIILDLVEKDEIDDKSQPKTPESAPQKQGRPASTAQRKAIKEALTEETNAKASDEEVKKLRDLLKDLMMADPEQEEWVQSIALKTSGFTDITASQCSALIEGVAEMLLNYAED